MLDIMNAKYKRGCMTEREKAAARLHWLITDIVRECSAVTNAAKESDINGVMLHSSRVTEKYKEGQILAYSIGKGAAFNAIVNQELKRRGV